MNCNTMVSSAAGLKQTASFGGLRSVFQWAILCLLTIFAWIQPVKAQTLQFGYVQTTLPSSGTIETWQAAKDAAGNVYIANSSLLGQVVELPAGGGPQIVVPLTGLEYARGVAVDQKGNLFVGDYGKGVVIELPAGGSQKTVASGLVGPTDLAVDASGNLFIADGVDGVYELPAGGGSLKQVVNVSQNISGWQWTRPATYTLRTSRRIKSWS